MKFIALALILLSNSVAVFAQKDTASETNYLKKIVTRLASDKMEGRAPGTKGEKLAMDLIVASFKKAGIPQAEIMLQPFTFTDKVTVSGETSLMLNDKELKHGENFWVLSESGNGSVDATCVYVKFGITAPDKNYDDYSGYTEAELNGKVFAIDISSPDGVHPHSAWLAYSSLSTKIENAIRHGASGVIFLDAYRNAELPSLKLSQSASAGTIPVIFAQGPAPKMLMDGNAIRCKLNARVDRIKGNGTNILATINNHASRDVIIGAHYDHLGLGDEGSLHIGAKMVHNGADDNASGIAALLLLAKKLQTEGPKNFNYKLIAFSAEEKGLLGSSFLVKSGNPDLKQTAYMINLDMVGRLENNQIAISGTGTSPIWNKLLPLVKEGNLSYKGSESGVGPSDHTSFYLKNVPVLHFFTGTHSDYHKPGDDADKINYSGIRRVTEFILSLVKLTSTENDIPFTKTKDQEQGKAPKFSVTLGIIPDYMFDGKGVRMDGVTDGKPASAAGMKAGDVILKLGEIPISDMQSYMKALSNFKKGDKVNALILRGSTEMTVEVKF
jgi:hypothetical protein